MTGPKNASSAGAALSPSLLTPLPRKAGGEGTGRSLFLIHLSSLADFITPPPNGFEDALQVFVDRRVPHSKDAEAESGDIFVAKAILLALSDMTCTVEFNDHAELRCEEVDDEPVEDVLAAKLDPVEAPVPQPAPQDLLSRCLIAAQLARLLQEELVFVHDVGSEERVSYPLSLGFAGERVGVRGLNVPQSEDLSSE